MNDNRSAYSSSDHGKKLYKLYRIMNNSIFNEKLVNHIMEPLDALADGAESTSFRLA